MRLAAAILGVITVAAGLLTADYVARPLSSKPTSKAAPTPGTLAASIEAPQTWAAARIWADPPAREERAPIVAAAIVETASSSPEPVAIDTLPFVFARAASQKPAGRRGLRAAKISRPHRLSRYVALQPIRGKRLHEPLPNSPAVAAVSEPASAPAEAEPIEFSLATRGD